MTDVELVEALALSDRLLGSLLFGGLRFRRVALSEVDKDNLNKWFRGYEARLAAPEGDAG